MTEMIVRIEELSPMRVASVCVVSAHPETDAWEKLQAWAKPLGLLDDLEKHPIFGFNSSHPSPDQEAYGYEFWIKVEQGIEPQGDLRVKDFPGGRYAVTTINGYPDPSAWRRLWDWVKSSEYKWRKTHELERPGKPIGPESEMVFDLYLPIE